MTASNLFRTADVTLPERLKGECDATDMLRLRQNILPRSS